MKGQFDSRLLMIPMWLTPMTFLVQYTIHLHSLIFLAYQSWLISFGTRIISQVMMLTVMEPLSNQGDIVLVSHGVTAKHTRNFTHGDSTLPEIMLYQGHGYFDAFCTRLQCCYQDGVVFAFSSAFWFHPPMSMIPQLFRMVTIWMRRRQILQYLSTLGLNITVMTVQRRKANGTHLRLLPLLCHCLLLQSLHSN